MRSLIVFLTILLSGCADEFEPCSQVEIGIGQSELVDILGEPFQKSDEVDNKLAYMYKGKKIPSIMLIELEKNDDNMFLVSQCNVL